MNMPRWLQAYATPPARAPQKAPPSGGVLVVDRWAIPQELRNHHAWACWRYSYDLERWSKPPYQPSGVRAEASDPSTWSSFDDAYHTYQDHASPQEGGRPFLAHHEANLQEGYRCNVCGEDHPYLDPRAIPILIEDLCDIDD